MPTLAAHSWFDHVAQLARLMAYEPIFPDLIVPGEDRADDGAAVMVRGLAQGMAAGADVTAPRATASVPLVVELLHTYGGSATFWQAVVDLGWDPGAPASYDWPTEAMRHHRWEALQWWLTAGHPIPDPDAFTLAWVQGGALLHDALWAVWQKHPQWGQQPAPRAVPAGEEAPLTVWSALELDEKTLGEPVTEALWHRAVARAQQLDPGLPADEAGWAPEHRAVHQSLWRPEKALALLSAGATLDFPDTEAPGPLEFALRTGHAGLVQTLVTAGASVVRRSFEGPIPSGLGWQAPVSPLMHMLAWCAQEHLTVNQAAALAEVLLAHGACATDAFPAYAMTENQVSCEGPVNQWVAAQWPGTPLAAVFQGHATHAALSEAMTFAPPRARCRL